jgi:carbonic anhydrase
MSATDINTSAVIEDAVAHLKVKHVMLCGHSSCSAIKAALGDSQLGGVLDVWLTPLKTVQDVHQDELDAIHDDEARASRLAELNVQTGVRILMANPMIKAAIKDRGLEVHGCFFHTSTGRIRVLGYGTQRRDASVNGYSDKTMRGKHAQLIFGESNASMTIRQ